MGWKHGLGRAALEQDPIAELERLYPDGERRRGGGPSRLEMARRELVEAAVRRRNLAVWHEMIQLSPDAVRHDLRPPGGFVPHARGELYNPQLPEVVADLLARGIAREGEPSRCSVTEPCRPGDPFLVNRDGDGFPNPHSFGRATAASTT